MKDNLATRVGAAIKTARKQRGLLQKQIAGEGVYCIESLRLIENGQRMPNISGIERIAIVLEIDPVLLISLSLDRKDVPEKYQSEYAQAVAKIKSIARQILKEKND